MMWVIVPRLLRRRRRQASRLIDDLKKQESARADAPEEPF